MISPAKKEFIEFMMSADVLRFGEFKTKSGRLSPYFVNTGNYKTGAQISTLGKFYAQCIMENCQDNFDAMFGPAYKGIPLVSTVAMNLARMGCDCPYAFNRKEAKDHGEGGTVIGAPLKGRVVIIDDVISAGTSVRESVALITANGATPAGVLIALDRMEKGGDAVNLTATSAAQDVETTFNMPVVSIANLKDLLSFMDGDSPAAKAAAQYRDAVKAYREQYGA